MSGKPRNGIGVDRSGGPVIDPTENVRALTEAAVKRQDDLREETNRRIDTELHCIRETSDLRSRQTEFVAQLRSDHAKEIRDLESRRLDAIRQVDVLAVGTAAERQLAATQTLANTTTTTAENIRTTLTTTATAIAAQTAATVAGLTERIAALEKSSYTGAGKEAVTSPAMEELIREVRGLRTGRATDTGKIEGADNLWKIISGVLGVVVLLGTFFFVILRAMGKVP